MIGLDTNILIRYLTQDDPRLSPRVKALIEEELSLENAGFISVVTMAEIVWVLERSYDFSRERITDAIELILRTDVFSVERRQDVFTAMFVMRESGGDFADVLIGRVAQEAGCSYTLTFDRRASRLPEFQLLAQSLR